VQYLIVVYRNVCSKAVAFDNSEVFKDTKGVIRIRISVIEEEQTTQWPKEKVKEDKQRSTKHA
jgi:hypothetical protein